MVKVDSAVDWVHGASSWVHGHILKWEPLIGGSVTRIRLAKGYEVILILIVDLRMDGPRHVSFLGSVHGRKKALAQRLLAAKEV
jgi:hypothetical protein